MKPSSASRSGRKDAFDEIVPARARRDDARASVSGATAVAERERLHNIVELAFQQDFPALYEEKKLLQARDYAALLPRLTARRDVLRGSPWEGPAILLAGIVGALGFNKLLALRGFDSLDTLRSTMTTALIWAVSVPFTSRVRNARSLAAVERARDALLVLLGESGSKSSSVGSAVDRRPSGGLRDPDRS